MTDARGARREVRRVAWFSPFPPVRTGIADCSAELVTALRTRGYAIDAYPTEAAHDFPWRHRQRPYDLIVYQFGNSSHHDYEWAYALRYPGLVVLHDTHLHHARAAFLLREGRAADYRAEFAWSHPDVPPEAAELAIAGMDSRLFYDWPMVRSLIDASRLVAVHGDATRRALLESMRNSTTPRLRQGYGEQGNSQAGLSERVVSIRLGHGKPVSAEERQRARREVRVKLGIPEDAILFGVFGGVTPEKRIPQIVAAFKAVLLHVPGARLLLGGAPAAHYDVHAGIAALGLQDRVTVTGYLEESDLTDHLAACDVSLNLRWPTAGETSGAWLRALAAGVPTIITDLVHLGEVPSLDPRTWTINVEVRAATREPRLTASQISLPASPIAPPVCVAIDIVDEDHSLRLAMRRLAQDAELRERLGRAGAAWWEREHSLDVMVEDYERVVLEVLKVRPVLEVQVPKGLEVLDVPDHLRPDGDLKLNALLEPFGIEAPI